MKMVRFIDSQVVILSFYLCICQMDCVVINQNESDMHKVLVQKNRQIQRVPPRRLQEQLSRLRQRSDVFPVRSQLNNQNFPHQQRPIGFNYPGPQILRRVQSNLPSNSNYFNLENHLNHKHDVAKVSRFSATKNNLYRQEPNTISKNPSEQYVHNFKASPPFNGNVRIVKEHSQPEYAAIPQHPIPKQQNRPFAQFGNPMITGAALREPQFQYAKPSVGDHKINEPIQPLQKYIVSKEAQDYLNFMSQNEYFLPKRDPNYKQLDIENDRNQYIQNQYQSQYQQRQQSVIRSSNPDSSSIANNYNQPIKVANLFYQEDTGTPYSFNDGSHPTGNSAPDGDNKTGNLKSISSAPTTGFTTPPLYTQRQYLQNSQTPQPIRLEFTEKDAVSPLSFTSAPENQTPTTTRRPLAISTNTKSPIIKPVTESEDDSEDLLDIHQPSTFSMTQKGSEEYCERICANIYDENDEIICGSDGYMYTGKAQLECYSSCLQISVSINSKGVCNPI